MFLTHPLTMKCIKSNTQYDLIFEQVSQGSLAVCKGTFREVRTKYEIQHLENNRNVELQGKRT